MCTQPDNSRTSDANTRDETHHRTQQGSTCTRHMTEYGQNPGGLFVLKR